MRPGPGGRRWSTSRAAPGQPQDRLPGHQRRALGRRRTHRAGAGRRRRARLPAQRHRPHACAPSEVSRDHRAAHRGDRQPVLRHHRQRRRRHRRRPRHPADHRRPPRRTPTANAPLLLNLCQRRVDGLLVVPAGDDHSYLRREVQHGHPGRLPRPAAAASCWPTPSWSTTAAAPRPPCSGCSTDGHRRIGILLDSLVRIHDARAARRRPGTRWPRPASATTSAWSATTSAPPTTPPAPSTDMLDLSRTRPTAFFCLNNRITVGALAGAVRTAATTPGLVGFDDFEFAHLMPPPVPGRRLRPPRARPHRHRPALHPHRRRPVVAGHRGSLPPRSIASQAWTRRRTRQRCLTGTPAKPVRPVGEPAPDTGAGGHSRACGRQRPRPADDQLVRLARGASC